MIDGLLDDNTCFPQQMLCPSPSESHQLSQEEVWTHQQHPTQEEAEVNSVTNTVCE